MPRANQRRRRVKGSGSVYRRSSDGRGIGRMRVRRGGLVQTHYCSGTIAEEAQAAVDALALELRGGGDPRRSRNLWVRDVIATWLGDVSRAARESTIERYRQVAKHVEDAVGEVRLAEISADTVRGLDEWLVSYDASVAARRSARRAFAAALNVAVRDGLLRRNPVGDVRPPRSHAEKPAALTAAEARALIAASEGERLGALYVLAVTSGLRLGELFWLHRRDVDFDRGVLHVRRSIREQRGGGIMVTSPKTERGARIIVPLARVAIEALRSHIARNAAGEYLFTAEKDGPLRKSVFTRKFWQPFLKRHELPESWMMRQLRGSATTLMAEGGSPVKAIQAILGHATAEMTIGIYTTSSAEFQRQGITAIDAIFSPR